MLEQLVQILMQRKATRFFKCQAIQELPAVVRVQPIGTGRWYAVISVDDLGIA